MDAKITKQRLSNLLSYDWLKMLAAIAIAVFLIILLFTMTATRPTNAQTYSIYSYTDVLTGHDRGNFAETLEKNKVFSYDILKVGYEGFSDNQYASTAFSARRAAGEGKVMFVSSADAEGKASAETSLCNFTKDNVYSGEGAHSVYNPQYFFEKEIYDYLSDFFGDGLTGEINAEAARARFLDRNGRDKRFRSGESKERGAALERERLKKLRDDFLAMRAAFAEGKLAYTALDGETGETVTYGWGEQCPEGYVPSAVNFSSLLKITELFYCRNADGKATAQSLEMIVFRNQSGEAYDLNYETVSLLSYLVEKYA